MTRKDYILIAAALERSKPLPIANPKMDAVRRSVFEMAARNIADALAQDNPRFDRERFLKACGVAS